MVDPNEDGVSHINVYSNGRTELGRYLSNFSDCDIHTEDGFFRTIEGYWYWLSCKDDRLRHTNGFASKQLGRELRAADWPKTREFEKKIGRAIMLKLTQPKTVEMLMKTGSMPFYHYYVYNGRSVMPKDGLWMINLIQEFRDELVKL